MDSNLLDNIDFCICKAVAVHCLPKYMQEAGINQINLAGQMGTSPSTICKWKIKRNVVNHYLSPGTDSSLAPTLLQVLQLSAILGKPFSQMIADIVEKESADSCLFKPLFLDELRKLSRLYGTEHGTGSNPDGISSLKGEEHYERIKKLARSRYLGFFLGSENQISFFVIETSAEPTDAASVHAFAWVVGKAEHVYRCNIVSPANQKHLYIYMRQDGGSNDRGLLTFHAGDDIQGEFQFGSGLLYSTERESEVKRLQWAVIVKISDNENSLTINIGNERRAEYIQRMLEKNALRMNSTDEKFIDKGTVNDVKAIIEQILREPLPESKDSVLDFECLKERQRDYKKKYKELLERYDLEPAWKETHPEQVKQDE